MQRKVMALVFMIGIILASLLPVSAGSGLEFTLLSAVVGEGGNIWLPSTIIVPNKHEVKLTLRNLASKDHGFTIEDLGVQEVIKAGETKEITITPRKRGMFRKKAVFRYYCHLHAGHVGGQMLVK
jgi:heme/copper-type cytochrome/quinol oxidase subunit 2